LDGSGKKTSPTPRNREFLADAVLTVWLLEDVELWHQRLRRPVWPLRLGRSQDLVGVRLDRTQLREVPGVQGGAVVADSPGAAGTLLRLPTAVAPGRERTCWGAYRFDSTGRSTVMVPESRSTEDGRAVALLPAAHPDLALRP
jgi:CRISPR-associated protein Cas5t